MLSVDQFRDSCWKLLRSSEGVDALVDKANNALVFPWKDKELRLYLDRPYALYEQQPDRLDDILREFLNSMLRPDLSMSPFASVARFIFPLLKPMGFVGAIGSQIASARPGFDVELCHQPWNGLGIVYVIDEPDAPNRVFITSQHLDEWGMELPDLARVALVNLGTSAPVSLTRMELPIGFGYIVEPFDDYAATRVLLTDVLKAAAADCEDDLLLAIPARDTVLLVPSSAPNARAWLEAGAVAQFQAAPDGLTPKVFRYDRARKVVKN